ncbi:hypothetical protein M670_00469 [Schinkia azotoformans MEV2011]|uniref:Uncharacterized protein n=1 Tax=Schinkia azotoformans MEV2011 TaxID=1348973 RepID=A0A072NU90_SCHAZ|nr:hypothetical protein [Schinkia azotoformans]KEF40443.1 hypothetical protein M670_00469 [Schinkia azotoformans MEV2011]MEC1696147.1 hypothetical protein [Schinkia azotoformans]MEC1725350.1 hypothetical protein [Schinkia azotoformans]MEC1779461.1 hypothetical protein [Schinkia azotoformans]MED4330054.1 hypothetical protein [Schinkia azotoformans]
MTNVDLSEVKKELKYVCNSINLEIKSIRTKLRADIKSMKKQHKAEKIPVWRTDEQIKKLENKAKEKIDPLNYQLAIYQSVIPVNFKGLIINYKLYESFMKKLKGFETKITEDQGPLFVEYREFGKRRKGVLALEDLSRHFVDFKSVPTLVLADEQEAKA